MSWDQAVKTVTPHVVKIETPRGYGTGFLAFYNHDKRWCGIATAAHVVGHADEWQEPIRIWHSGSDGPLFLIQGQRVIFLDYRTDSAVIFFLKGHLNLPEIPVALLPVGDPLSIGHDVGWLGYPAIEESTLCFFAGSVSAPLPTRKAYLIDGVAINGVSGGPVIHRDTSDAVQIIGCVSAYHANRVTGETLPGLLKAQDVSHFHGVAESVRSVDEANAKKAEFEAAQKTRPDPEQRAAAASEPSPDGPRPTPAVHEPPDPSDSNPN